MLRQQQAIVLRPDLQAIAMIGEHILENAAQHAHEVHVDGAARGLGNRHMEVEVVFGLVALGTARLRHQFEVMPDLVDLFPRAALRRAPGGPNLDAGPNFRQVVKVAAIDPDQLSERRMAFVAGGDDPGAATLDCGHEALSLELLQRGAHRDPADIHHLGQLPLARQAFAGRQFATGDQA